MQFINELSYFKFPTLLFFPKMSASAMSNKIDKVEHQCKELILEINQHLSMEVNENKNILLRDQHQYVRKKVFYRSFRGQLEI